MNNLIALSKVLGEYESRRNEKLFFCPYCHHTKRKLSYNVDLDYFKCWVCEVSGRNIYKLLKLKGETEDSKEYARIKFTKNDNCRLLHVDVKQKKYIKPVLPKEYRTLTKDWKSPYYNLALNFLKGRGVTEEDIYRYKIGYAEDGEFAYRIIFPSFDADGFLNFVVGRDYYFDKFPKYYHKEYNKDIVFNEYLINWNNPVTLVEGIFDSIKAGYNSIPLQGSYLSENSYLFKRIIFSDGDLYLALDQDAAIKQLGLAQKFLEHGKEFKIIKLSKKDPGEMTKEEFQHCKERAVSIKNRFDLIKERL